MHPTKSVGAVRLGTMTALQSFQELGTIVDLVAETFSVPRPKVKRNAERITTAAHALTNGHPQVFKFVRAITTNQVEPRLAIRIRLRVLDAVIDSTAVHDHQTLSSSENYALADSGRPRS